MKLIAQKPCSFGGKKFYIGDEIPANLVLEPKAQASMGVLAILKDEAVAIVNDEAGTGPATMEVVIPSGEGIMSLDLTQEGLQAVVDALTASAEDAKPIIERMTGDELILIHHLDSRKAIKEAAEKRGKAITPEESAPEESAGEQ